MRTRKIDASIDRQIITGMVISKEFLEKIHPIYKPEFLMADFAVTVAGWCLDYYKHYEKAPGQHIQDIFYAKQREGLDDTQADTIQQFLESLSEEYEEEHAAKFNPTYILDTAQNLFKERSLKGLVEEIEANLSRGNIIEADQLVKGYCSPSLSTVPGKGYTAKELMEMETEDIRWVIDGVIPEGLTLFAGKPKVGKSFFLLNAAINLADGSDAFGSIPTEQATVLYLALEDPHTRIKDRLSKMLDKPAPDKLHIHPLGEWPRIHEGGMDHLETWMANHRDTRLVIVDTLEKFKRPQKTSGHFYSEDYQNISPLQEFANKHHIGVVVVHHTKKTATKDPFDEITGTVGLTAAADTLAKLDRAPNGQGRIFAFRGRDVGENELSFRFDDFRYVLEGEAAEQYQGSDSRRSIKGYLSLCDEPVSRKELVEAMENRGVGKGVDVLINKMVNNGDIKKVGYGLYAHGKYEDQEWQKAICKRIRERLNINRNT